MLNWSEMGVSSANNENALVKTFNIYRVKIVIRWLTIAILAPKWVNIIKVAVWWITNIKAVIIWSTNSQVAVR